MAGYPVGSGLGILIRRTDYRIGIEEVSVSNGKA